MSTGLVLENWSRSLKIWKFSTANGFCYFGAKDNKIRDYFREEKREIISYWKEYSFNVMKTDLVFENWPLSIENNWNTYHTRCFKKYDQRNTFIRVDCRHNFEITLKWGRKLKQFRWRKYNNKKINKCLNEYNYDHNDFKTSNKIAETMVDRSCAVPVAKKVVI